MDTRWRYSLRDLLGLMALGIAAAIALRYLEPISLLVSLIVAFVMASFDKTTKIEFMAGSWCSLWLALVVCGSFAAAIFDLGHDPVPSVIVFAAMLLACAGAYALSFFVYLRQTTVGVRDSSLDSKPRLLGKHNLLTTIQAVIQIGIPLWMLIAIPDRLVLKWCYATLYQCIALNLAVYVLSLADACYCRTAWQLRLWILFVGLCVGAATTVPK